MSKSVYVDNLISFIKTLDEGFSLGDDAAMHTTADTLGLNLNSRPSGIIKAIKGESDNRYYAQLNVKIQDRFPSIDILKRKLTWVELNEVKWTDFEKLNRQERHKYNTHLVFNKLYSANSRLMAQELGCSLSLIESALKEDDPGLKVARLFKTKLNITNLTIKIPTEVFTKYKSKGITLKSGASELDLTEELRKLTMEQLEQFMSKLNRAHAIIRSDHNDK
ncbi:hypothetical protein AB4455_03505 [Vibrio sp. 10N.261.46.E12]|nr:MULTISPECIES: hypothetical protein [unclassified Vibrio]OMO38340.1 hypothetical protein BH584_01615 [Vibrio sp. 10N.261.45.E1]PMJ19535.1 hypothetical protein BCU27_21580 [Vibrio sp. 10N.286.45.B6]PML84282.1 hypothetical protein BCT66_17800 [Vibrio sp. 10N.261.49.E11]PMM79795.1 hypothetical protein BCT46_19580 [Vibrio sp. 10N.261.46.E8]PMN47531.1 hypothetical protein BCT32_09490 [Vibrio sp. 10N.261.45.E11]